MSESFPPVTEDIAFELLILHAVAERGRTLHGARAAALRSHGLWEAPPPRPAFSAKKPIAHVASALIIASTLSVMPPGARPAWAQRNEIRVTVLDAQTGKPLADVVLRDEKGNTVARTGADGKLAFSAPAGAERYTLERVGYQSVPLQRSQLGGSNLVSMTLMVAKAEPTAAPTPRATPRPTPKATARPKPATTARPTPKPVKAAARPVRQVKPKPAAKALPPAERQDITPAKGYRYVVKRGDTLWDISQKTLGNPRKWQSLYAANRSVIKRPSMIYPGQTLLIPAEVAKAPAKAPSKGTTFRGTHQVTRGDTLWEISQDVYGDPMRWKDIYRANRKVIKRPSLIYPGQTLKLPK